ncbi:hypothetical protein H5410_029926 [Solanum commersonii]|uniref:Uncharacterized protein n=1 Tax=Solanum commersonii TaxID=4109 RepID=A0A9J5YH54_SOLCO|nr:hypothetical protein H5410_029926 [Solanum commersonii]
MTEGFKRLNQTIEKLEIEKEKMTQHIQSLQEKIRSLLGNTNQTIPLQIQDYPKIPKSSPSHSKMDKTGVHSPMNVKKSIVSAKGTTSHVQTVVGKDSSNPLMADTLPKSVRILPESFNTNPNPEPEPANLDPKDSRSDENDLSIDQFTQHYNPNEDDDSGMSFDSDALHNLDT